MTGRRLSWLLVAVVAVVAFGFGAFGDRGASDNAERITALTKQIRCLQCPGESVAESRVAWAANVRAQIARLVAAGKTDGEVKQTLVDQYRDERILLVPQAKGTNSLLWALPVMVLVCGGGGLALAFRRWKAESSMVPTESDRRSVAAARDALGAVGTAATVQAASVGAPSADEVDDS